MKFKTEHFWLLVTEAKMRLIHKKVEKSFVFHCSPDCSGYPFLPAFRAKKIIAKSRIQMFKEVTIADASYLPTTFILYKKRGCKSATS